MFNEPKYSFVVGLICAILFFIVQLLLCFIAKKNAIKLIPVYLILSGFAFCLAMYCGLFGTGSFCGHMIGALILAIVVVIACIGESMAWVVYGIYKCIYKWTHK